MISIMPKTLISSIREQPYLGHLLGDLGQVLPLLADDEAVEPGGSGHSGHAVAVGLRGQEGGGGWVYINKARRPPLGGAAMEHGDD